MSEAHYLELYKKYRPETWDDIVGQDRIVSNLRSSVVKDRIPTMYGFFGEKGTGKSSSAYVLAKAMNCERLDKKTGNPCGDCENCDSIEDGSLSNVHFVSMANYGSVDNVRQIVQQARIQAFNGRKQVWVLDEVHNLSKAAFDSLLVPLDDNDISKSALFIMCSTAPEKIPDTLMSRARVFKFLPVDADTMAEHLREIVDAENIDASDEMIELAVRRGRGSVRETLSVFENAIEGVSKDSEEASFQPERRLLLALAKGDTALMFKTTAKAHELGVNPHILAQDVFSALRDLILTYSAKVPSRSVFDEAEGKKVYGAIGGLVGASKLAEVMGKSITNMSLGADPFVMLEIALMDGIRTVKMIRAKQKDKSNPWA